MKCSSHTEIDAVAICIHCGRGLCSPCTTKSQSGRTVCSAACGTALLDIEQALRGLRDKTVRSHRGSAWFSFVLAAIFGGFGVNCFIEEEMWRLGVFLFAVAAGFTWSGFAALRIAKRRDSA